MKGSVPLLSRLGYVALGAAMAIGALAGLHTPAIYSAKSPQQREIILPATPKPDGGDLRSATPAIAGSEHDAAERAARIDRIRAYKLDRTSLRAFIQRYRETSRDKLIAGGLLSGTSPAKGTALLGPEHRSPQGNALLQQAKDTLYALLFGDETSHTQFARVQRELLTLTLPRRKAPALGFMQAATELAASGTWQDPKSVSSDERAENVIVEVEYGEIAEELIGDGILVALRLINNLEVNEQVLYARMIDIEQSTLIH